MNSETKSKRTILWVSQGFQLDNKNYIKTTGK